MRYTSKNITFDNVLLGGMKVPSGPFSRNGAYSIDGDDITNIRGYLLNAIDINWNGAKVDANTTINTTAELLDWIKSKGNNTDNPSGQQRIFFINVEHETIPSIPSINYYNSATDTFINGLEVWTATNTNPGENLDTYIIWVWFVNNAPYSIDGPIRIYNGGSGGTGSNGEDANEIEWIYRRVREKPELIELNTWKTILANAKGNAIDKSGKPYTEEDAIPNNWEDHPSGIDLDYKYEYASFRTSTIDSTTGKRKWGETGFSTPILWSAYGEKGTDGDGVEYIFYADTDENPDFNIFNPPDWTEDEGFLNPKYRRENSGWSDDPIDLNTLGQGAVEWVSMRKKQNGVWQAYSEPAVWSRLGKDGIVDGYTIDLSNENMPVGTDDEGNVSNYSNQTLIQVFHNGTPLIYEETSGTPSSGHFSYTIGTITRSDDPDGGPVTGIGATINQQNPAEIQVSISSITGFDKVNAYIPVIVTLPNNTTREVKITLYGIATGESGQYIELYTNCNVIRLNSDKTEIIPQTLDIGVKIGRGENMNTYLSGDGAESRGYTFKYKFDDDDNFTPREGSIDLTDQKNHNSISILMYKDNKFIDSETIPYITDGSNGTSAPFYTKEWYAWSDNETTLNVNTPPSIIGEWSETIPLKNARYLWKKIIKYVLDEETNLYNLQNAEYFRMSGTDGVSIRVKGTAVVVIPANGNFPASGFENGNIGLKQGNSTPYKLTNGNWLATNTSEDGDSYTITKDCTIDLDGDGTSANIKGHLITWSDEANKWVDLGEFKGENGETYYSHIVWAENVIFTQNGKVDFIDGYLPTKSSDDTTHFWMGTHVDQIEDDPSEGDDILKEYTWTYTKGTDGKDGVDGKDSLTLNLDTYNIAFPVDNNYNVENTLTYNVGVKMYLGLDLIDNINITGLCDDEDISIYQVTNNGTKLNAIKILIGEATFLNTIPVYVKASCSEGSRTAILYLVPTTQGKGADGKDGITITATPPILILNLSTTKDNNGNYSIEGLGDKNNSGDVYSIINAKRNGELLQISRVVRNDYNCDSENSSLKDNNKNIKLWLTNVDTENGNNNGYVNVTLTIEKSTYIVHIPWYVNLLGTWKESVEAGVENIVANKVNYEFIDGVLATNGYSFTSVRDAVNSILLWKNSKQSLYDGYNESITQLNTWKQNAEQTISSISSISGDGGINLFGFTKCSFDNSTPFILGYGIIAKNESQSRVSLLGFNGRSGYYTVSCEIKADSNKDVLLLLCDEDPESGVNIEKATSGIYIGKNVIKATEQWKRIIAIFNIPSSNGFISGSYNGFFDVEASSNDNVYIRKLMIEYGNLASSFSICKEDASSKIISTLVNENGWNINENYLLKITDNDALTGLDTYKANIGSTTESNTFFYKEGTLTLYNRTVYTLSFWAKSSVNGIALTAYLYLNIINDCIYVDILKEDGVTTEGVLSDGHTNISLLTEWKRYYVHFYVMSGTATNKSCSLRYDKENSRVQSGNIFIAGVRLDQGYITENQSKDYQSIMEQTAKHIDMSVLVNSVKKAGIELTTDNNGQVTNGIINATADTFKIQNSGGNTTMSVDSSGNLDVTSGFNVKNNNLTYVAINGGENSEHYNNGEITILDTLGLYVKRDNEGFRITSTNGFLRWANNLAYTPSTGWVGGWVPFYSGRFVKSITLNSGKLTETLTKYDDFILVKNNYNPDLTEKPVGIYLPTDISDGKVISIVNIGRRINSINLDGYPFEVYTTISHPITSALGDLIHATLNYLDRMELVYYNNIWYANYMSYLDYKND